MNGNRADEHRLKTRGGDGSSAGAASNRDRRDHPGFGDHRDGFHHDRDARRRHRRARRALILLAALAASVITAAVLTRASWPPHDWLLVMCDVGQGDAEVLADGRGAAIVVDAGPDPAKEDRCLTDLGIRHVRLAILTHFHADHVDGLPGVLRGRQVDEIETSPVEEPPEGAAKVHAWASAAGVRTSTATAGERRSYGSLTWDVLWPDSTAARLSPSPRPPRRTTRPKRGGKAGKARAGTGEDGSIPNNASVVLHVRAQTPDGPVTMLLTGDIEPPAQQAILAAHRDPAQLASDIFKVPHHGSSNQAPGLIAAVRPRVALISVGAGNTYGHPAPRTLALAASTGGSTFRTDRDGDIAVIGTAGRLRVAVRR